ncbi:MAG: DUF948 domain-containing protein [Candidatus Aminicenantales bacterium]
MPLTLNQFLLLVLTLVAVVAVTFLAAFLAQLRRTAREAEKTLAEIRDLAAHLKETSLSVQAKLDDAGEVIEASKKTMVSLSEIAWFVASKIVRPSSRLWPLVFPLTRLIWRQWKKHKEGKNGG